MRASAGNNATKCFCSHFLTSTFSRSIGCNQWRSQGWDIDACLSVVAGIFQSIIVVWRVQILWRSVAVCIALFSRIYNMFLWLPQIPTEALSLFGDYNSENAVTIEM